MGNVLQIDAKLKNIIVRKEASNCPLKLGDCILKVENNDITSCEHFENIISSTNKNNISILIRRDNSTFCLNCNRNDLSDIRFNDVISGYATLTYINPKTKDFGAVAHPIGLGSSRNIDVKQGYVSFTNKLNVKKSYKGSVGSLNATKDEKIGQFTSNDNFGIKGKVDNINLSKYKKYKVANINEVKLGKAQIILQNKDNICKKYNVEIINIENQKRADSKGIKIKVTDPELISQNGGIVQGMSGTPIIQGDKIVGAISHALESNPRVGYAVHIKWMLQENE